MAGSSNGRSRTTSSSKATDEVTGPADEPEVQEAPPAKQDPATTHDEVKATVGEPLGGTEVATDVPAPVPAEDQPAGRQGGRPVPYLNMTTGPMVYDVDGHTVDGNTWTPEINLDRIGQQQREQGRLLPESAL